MLRIHIVSVCLYTHIHTLTTKKYIYFIINTFQSFHYIMTSQTSAIKQSFTPLANGLLQENVI